MGFLQDALAIFKKRELSFIESSKETENVYTFVFEKEPDMVWRAGQHGLFGITHKKIKNGTKPFTLSSAPSDKTISITMRIGENQSEFKRAMLELKRGMKVNMSGPVGSFYPKDNAPVLFIAGGIGITPFRSMVRQWEAEGSWAERPVRLLYLDSNKDYLFQGDFDRTAGRFPLHVTYLDSRKDLNEHIRSFTDLHGSNGSYMIAGPKAMTDDLSLHLRNNRIPKNKIKLDAFWGY